MSRDEEPVTDMLARWSRGDAAALGRVMEAVYGELRRRAAAQLRHERRDHTLQPTALVHEAFLRLVGQDRTRWHDRFHFYAVASRMMRRVLIDHARRRAAAKRGEDPVLVSLAEAEGCSRRPVLDALALEEALTALERLDPAQARIVEMRIFGELTVREIAGTLGMPKSTVHRLWKSGAAFVHQRCGVRQR